MDRSRPTTLLPPMERLIAARLGDHLRYGRSSRAYRDVDGEHAFEDLLGLKQTLSHRPFEVAFDDGTEQGLTWYLDRELSRSTEDIRYAGSYESFYEGEFAMWFRVCALDGDHGQHEHRGTSSVGAIVDCDYYVYGADLEAVRASGFMLSWPAAQWLYAAVKVAIVALHANGKLHRITPRQIRLALFHRPYGGVGYHDFETVPAPPIELVGRPGLLDPRKGVDPPSIDKADALSVLALAVGGLTHHPDATIDRLLRDPSPDARVVLRDALLELGHPAEEMLRDRACEPGLHAALPLVDAATIDDELTALWERVIALDPLMSPVPDELRAAPKRELVRSGEPGYSRAYTCGSHGRDCQITLINQHAGKRVSTVGLPYSRPGGALAIVDNGPADVGPYVPTTRECSRS